MCVIEPNELTTWASVDGLGFRLKKNIWSAEILKTLSVHSTAAIWSKHRVVTDHPVTAVK